MSEELYLTHHYYELKIHAFVLMSNHFHLIATTPLANISVAMKYFMSNTSRRLNEESGRINQTYGGRHFKCILRSHYHFLNAYKYVYRNPVEAKLCEQVELYPFSTLSGCLGLFPTLPLIIPLEEDLILFGNPRNGTESGNRNRNRNRNRSGSGSGSENGCASKGMTDDTITETLEWLNCAPDPIRLDAVRWGLKRNIFASKRSRLNNKPILGDYDTL